MMINRHYVLTVVVVAVLFAVLMEAAIRISAGLGPDSPWRIPVALMPLLPIMVIGFRMEWQLFQRYDEMQKQMHLTALMFGSGALVIYCGAGVCLTHIAGLPELPLLGALLVHAVSYAVSLMVLQRRYR